MDSGTPERPNKRASVGTPPVKMEPRTADNNSAAATAAISQEEIDKYPTVRCSFL